MAIVPAVFLVWYFHKHDRFPEPPKVLWLTFLFGAASAFLAAKLETSLSPMLRPMAHGSGAISIGFVLAFLVVAIPEELCKLSVLLLYSFRQPDFDEEMDGIVYGAVAAIGFATVENLAYVSRGGAGVALLRALMAVPMHAFMGAISGYYVGRYILRRRANVTVERKGNLWVPAVCGLAVAMLVHGLYDFPLLAAQVARLTKADTETRVTIAQLSRFTTASLIMAWGLTRKLVKRTGAEQEMRLSAAEHLTDEIQALKGQQRRAWLKAGFGGLAAALSCAMMLGMLVSLARDPSQSAGSIAGAVLILVVLLGIPAFLAVILMRGGIEQQNKAVRALAQLVAQPIVVRPPADTDA